MTRKRIATVLRVIVLLTAVGAVFFVQHQRTKGPEIFIVDKTVDELVRELRRGHTRGDAMRKLVIGGPEILPTLVKELEATHSMGAQLQSRLLSLQGKRQFLKDATPPQMMRTCLILTIGEICEANRHADNFEREFQMAADALVAEFTIHGSSPDDCAWALGACGPRAQAAVPALVSLARGSAPSFRYLDSLASIGPGTNGAEIVSIATNAIASNLHMRYTAGLRALAACGAGHVPPELKPQLQFMMKDKHYDSGAAALACLHIDTNEPTALAIVRARLHPQVETNLHIPMVEMVAVTPNIAALFQPELRELAANTNARMAVLARRALKETGLKVAPRGK